MGRSVRRELREVIDNTLAPALAIAGFRRREKHDFLRPIGDERVQVLSVQLAELQTAACARWTYNLAVYIPECIEARGLPRPEEPPDAVGCFSRLRIGMLRPDRSAEEFWYELASDDFDTVHALVRNDAETLVIPHFDRTRTARGLLDFYRGPQGRTGGAFEHLVLELLLGEVEAARATYARCFEDRPDVGAYVEKRFGVRMPDD